MQDKHDNPGNAKYYTEIGGSSNMTTLLQAYSLATKGHYYQISEKAKDKIAVIVDKNNKPIEPIEKEDDTYLGIERISGVNMQAK